MACFLVPATEAIVTTVAAKIVEKHEGKTQGEEHTENASVRLPISKKLKKLSGFLWGGSVLLAFEHVWHGEITPWPPFLTAAGSQAEVSAMLHEMSTVGVAMAVLVTVFWGVVTFTMDRAAAKNEANARMCKTAASISDSVQPDISETVSDM